ncbi:MAG: hypothetical protein ABSC23_17355 [Bryobacteraceae bacterium]|jgi:type II secretory pathway pseudopilin PulG
MRACRDRESGFALLVVLLVAAVLAISLYSEIPRVAFQSQRHKEQLLMERGEQYKRALQMFYTTTRQYPKSMDDLETFNGRHFLRHKYVDPMTGKDDWRIIHVQGNVVTDSILSNKPQGGQQASDPGNYVSANLGVGQTAEGGQGLRPQDRRRASEGGSGDQGLLPFPSASPAPDAGSPPGTPPNPGEVSPPGTPGSQPASGVQALLGIPGQPVTLPGASGSAANPQTQQGGGGSYVSALPGVGGQAAPPPGPASGNSAQLGLPGLPPGAPGQPGPPNPAMPGGFPPGVNPAASLINDLLTRPNPQGAMIVQQALQGPGGSIIGSGGLIYASASNRPGGSSLAQGSGLVAGVASASEQQSIMVYNDHTAYNEWEFIFDPSKVTPLTPLTSATAGGASGSNQGGQTGTGPGTATGVGARSDTAFGGFGGIGGMGPGGTPQSGLGQSGLLQSGLGQSGITPSGTGQGGTGQSGATGMQTGSLPPIRMGRP